MMEDGVCPASIMHPHEIPDSCVDKYYYEYIVDLGKRMNSQNFHSKEE
jgi:hypothetical protein